MHRASHLPGPLNRARFSPNPPETNPPVVRVRAAAATESLARCDEYFLHRLGQFDHGDELEFATARALLVGVATTATQVVCKVAAQPRAAVQ